MSEEKQATPDAELFRRLSSPSEPKTELEHFAWRLYWNCAEDNTSLRQRVVELKKQLARGDELFGEVFDQHPGEYEAIKADAKRFCWLVINGYFRAGSLDMGGNHSWISAGRFVGKGGNTREAIDAAIKGESDVS